MNTIVILALLTYIGITEYYTRKERKDLLRLIKARDLDEVSRAELVEKAKPEAEEKDPDVVPVEATSDEQFDKMIQQELQT